MPKYQIPDLSNATPGSIVDELARLSVIENYAKAMRKIYKEALKSKVQAAVGDVYEGDIAVLTIDGYDQERLDQEKLKVEYPAAYNDCRKTGYVTTFRPTLKGKSELNTWLDTLKKELDIE